MTDYLDFDERAEPPIGTLRDVARRHGTDLEGARRIMGLPEKAQPKVPFGELKQGTTFRFNATVWLKGRGPEAVAIRDRYGPVRSSDGRQHAATFARHVLVEPVE